MTLIIVNGKLLGMEYLIICSVTLLISIITLLSGFGLGTVLVPVFAIFFPLPLAIASTAIIHLFNNVFQACIVGKFANRSIVLKFGIPAAIAALIGGFLLSYFANLPPIFSHQFSALKFNITVIGLIVGVMVILSSLFELIPKLANLSVPSQYVPLGGILSGFFGGLSGNQGTLRSAFLIKSGLNKAQFIGTSVICSVIVDTARILVYGFAMYNQQLGNVSDIAPLLIAACLTAFLGSYIGSRVMHKITFKTLQILVGVMLLVLGFVIIFGIGKS